MNAGNGAERDDGFKLGAEKSLEVQEANMFYLNDLNFLPFFDLRLLSLISPDKLERKYRQNLMKLAYSERLTEEERKAIVMMNSAYESNKIQLQEMEDHYEAGYQEKEELEVMFEKLEEEGDGLAKDIRDQKAVIEGQNRRVKELETENGKLQTELAKFKTSDDRGLSFFD